MTRVDYKIDGALKARVLAKLGRTEGHVEINHESWDFGFCSTCSYPESGFSVKVDGEVVWPAPEYLDEFGGINFADDQGYVRGSSLTVYGQFDAWLSGRPWDPE